MGEDQEANCRKRTREELPERGEVESEGSVLSSAETRRVRNDSDINSSESDGVDSDELGLNLLEVDRIPNDSLFLGILDEPDAYTVADHVPVILDLDSVIRSFEEEILLPSQPQQPPELLVVASESDKHEPDLGYLLEASDDDLGLPATVSQLEEQDQINPMTESGDFSSFASEDYGASEILGFQEELPSYELFGFGIGETQLSNGELATVGELFPHESADFSELLHWSESLYAM